MTDELPDRSEQEIWHIGAIIRATHEQAEEVLAALGRILCPDPDHDGPCPVPWTTIMSPVYEDVDEDTAASWIEQYDDEDRRDLGEA